MHAVFRVCVYMRMKVSGGTLRYIEILCHFRRHVLLPQAGVMTDGKDRHQAEGDGEVKSAQWFLKTGGEKDKCCCSSKHTFLLSLALSG